MQPYNTDSYVRYRYRLNSNFKDESESKQLEGTTIRKSEWTVFPQKIQHLFKFIKTLENEDGILDYECFHLIKGEIYDSSILNYEKLKSGKAPNYTRAVLSTMKRPQLEKIANLYNVDSMRRINTVLVNDLLDKQEIIKNILKNNK